MIIMPAYGHRWK